MTNEVLHALGRLALGFFCIAAAVWGDAGPIGRGYLCFLAGTSLAIGFVRLLVIIDDE